MGYKAHALSPSAGLKKEASECILLPSRRQPSFRSTDHAQGCAPAGQRAAAEGPESGGAGVRRGPGQGAYHS